MHLLLRIWGLGHVYKAQFRDILRTYYMKIGKYELILLMFFQNLIL